MRWRTATAPLMESTRFEREESETAYSMIIIDSRRPDNLIAPSRRQSADCEAYASDDFSLEHLHVVVSEKVYNTAQSRVCEVQKEAGVKWRIIRLDGAFTQALRKEERQRSTTAILASKRLRWS